MKLDPQRPDQLFPAERRAAFTMAGLYVVRMLGLFLILPVFALYAEHLRGSTPMLAGFAIGVYGLSQACLQIPFGAWSDRWGRKPIIIIGLLILALGSIVAALADSIYGVIIGRAIQGAGAISGAVLALAADLTRDESRTKVMAIIGVSIGVSFALAMVLGPLLNAWVGVAGIFWTTAALALISIAVLHFVVPQPPARTPTTAGERPRLLLPVLADPELRRLNIGVFALHMLLTASFVALPLVLAQSAGLPVARHSQLYLIVMVTSVAAMAPGIVLAERRQIMKPVFLAAILALCLSEIGLLEFHRDVVAIGVLLFVFFTGFNLLEAMLPSLSSRFAPANAKGTALGLYATSQFLGTFVGGAAGGWVHGAFGLNGVFAFAALGALLWFVIAYPMANPRRLSHYRLAIGALSESEAERMAKRLSEVPGVAEAVVSAAEGVAYLKVDKRQLDEAALRQLSTASAGFG